jgi:hypothetical protein
VWGISAETIILMSLATTIKQLKDTGIFDAIIDEQEIQQRALMAGQDWQRWDGSVTVLFNPDSWAVRVKPQPREWRIFQPPKSGCMKHGCQRTVIPVSPGKDYKDCDECYECEIIRVVEVL